MVAISTVQELVKPIDSSLFNRCWQVVRECVIREFGSCLRHTWWRAVYWLQPHCYGVNPSSLPPPAFAGATAKVALLLAGQGGHPSCFLPLAKELQGVGLTAVHTVDLLREQGERLPIMSLVRRVTDLTQGYLSTGYAGVDFAFVGHSMGALAASQVIWGGESAPKGARFSLLISLAGRLRYLANDFAWFCESERPAIEHTFQALSQDPHRVALYTLWGDRDAIVPKSSALVPDYARESQEVRGWGHGGIVFAQEAHRHIVTWFKTWVLP